ncbi:hypothetical protein HDE_08520 [Halotydeus destructor]|nr:hypothetical protein HDE_08520 [Halotydeus destructor]
MKFVDIRFPCEPESECAEMIENGIRRHLLHRIGSHVTEVRVLKQHKSLITTDVLAGLQLSPKAVKTLVGDVENHELSELLLQLVSNGKTIKKQQFLNFTVESMKSIVKTLEKFDCSMISAIKQEASAVQKLEIAIQGDWLDVDVLVKCFNLFPNLKLVSLKFLDANNKFSKTIDTSKLIKLLDLIDSRVRVELYISAFLVNTHYVDELKDHLSRLQINADTGRSANYSAHDHDEHFFPSYCNLGYALSQHLKPEDLHRHLNSIYRVKDITDSLVSVSWDFAYIARRGSSTEKLNLVFDRNRVLTRVLKDVTTCITKYCPNLKQIEIKIGHTSTQYIKRLIEELGSSLETIKLDYRLDRTLPVNLVSLIVKCCPNLKSFKSNGMRSEDVDKLKKFLKRFSQMRHLDIVKIVKDSHPQSRLIYCNGRISA